jgi:ABC-type glycerol-3-phosphate transport system permease component
VEALTIQSRVAFSPPFALRMPRGFVKAVPEALRDAAYLDGASRAGIPAAGPFPLVPTGLVATTLLSFLSARHDFPFTKSCVNRFTKSRVNSDISRTRTATADLRAGRSGQGLM